MGKLNEPKVKEKYQIEITNRLAALENLNVDEDVNRAWENVKENIKISSQVCTNRSSINHGLIKNVLVS